MKFKPDGKDSSSSYTSCWTWFFSFNGLAASSAYIPIIEDTAPRLMALEEDIIKKHKKIFNNRIGCYISGDIKNIILIYSHIFLVELSVIC